MTHHTATARSFSNIAFIKYWGNRDDPLRLPSNGSISMNLKGIETITTVRFDPLLSADRLSLGGAEQDGAPLERASRHLDVIRSMAGTALHAAIESHNNFPTGTGIASSASAFSALTVAACAALGLTPDERTLSQLARRGSGSACRSVPGGFVEWHAGSDDETSFGESIAPPEHWDLVDLVAVVSSAHKVVGSTGGHALAPTSPLQAARVADTPRRLEACRDAILNRNFAQLADVIEHDTLLMHAVMMTSHPALIYWLPDTLRILDSVRQWRLAGLDAAFTIDAGPNVHVITTSNARAEVRRRLEQVGGIERLLEAGPGGPAEVIG